MIVGTTPTITIKRSVLNDFNSAKVLFWNTNPLQGKKLIEKVPRLQADKTFKVDFSEQDTIDLASDTNSEGKVNWEIFYLYLNEDGTTKSNGEKAKNYIPIYPSKASGGATGTGGVDGDVIYEAEALQATVEVPTAGTGENGATFIPSAVVEGNSITFSWTNDRGLPNPEPVTLTVPSATMFAFEIVGDDLVMSYEDGTQQPNVYIQGNDLIWEVE